MLLLVIAISYFIIRHVVLNYILHVCPEYIIIIFNLRVIINVYIS